MFAFCIESSHSRGMGHLFRASAFARHLMDRGDAVVFFVNDDAVACAMLKDRGFLFETVDLRDTAGNWEGALIARYGITTWINDRLDTDGAHARRIVECKARLITFDDRGSGAEYADLNIAALVFDKPELVRGKSVLLGVEYLILNGEIVHHTRLRTTSDRILVSLGGSDTYGVTEHVVGMLETLGLKADVLVGPSYRGIEALQAKAGSRSTIMQSVPSLIATFARYDCAITGGGITPFEANASGLPCLTISSEEHEREICRHLQSIGSSVYIGHRTELTLDALRAAFAALDPAGMSRRGMEALSTSGIGTILARVDAL